MKKLFVALGSFVLGVGCTNLSVGPAPSGGGTVKGKTEQGSAEIADRGAERFRELASVRAFQSLRTALDQQFEIVLADSKTEREAFEGMRALLRILAMATDTALDGNPKAPHFARMDTKVRKVGGDNPDAEYDAVRLDNEWDYVIRGNIGSVRHLGFTITGNRENGRASAIGYLSDRTLGADPNGDFEIYLTKQPVDHPNWIDTSQGLSSILVRQYIGDRDTEILATYQIEVVGRTPYEGIPYSTDAEIAEGIAGAVNGLRFMSSMHRTVKPELFDNPNSLEVFNSDDFGADISSKDNLYMVGTYQIDEEEALIIETDPLDVRYWNIAVESRWHETVDYLTRRTHRSLDHSVIDPDGKLRFVLAHGKAPHPNWLDTGGHREGYLTFRWVGERDAQVAQPEIMRIPLADVTRVLEERRSGRAGHEARDLSGAGHAARFADAGLEEGRVGLPMAASVGAQRTVVSE